MNRRNQILSGILILQVLLAVFSLWPKGASGNTGDMMLSDLDQVSQIIVLDNTGQEIILRKKGNEWVLPNADDYPCQPESVSSFLDKLATFKTNRLVAQAESSYKRLRVADQDYERRVTISWPDGSTRTLYLGTAPSYSVIHARLDNLNGVYLVSGISLTDLGAMASSWIDTMYLALDSTQIRSMVLENSNGRFEFARGEDGSWSMLGLDPSEILAGYNVDSLASRAAAFRIIQPLGKQEQESYGTRTPLALLTVQTISAEGDDQTHVLRIGAKDERLDGYVAISSDSAYYVLVAEFNVQNMIEWGHEDFIEPPPTPTPTS